MHDLPHAQNVAALSTSHNELQSQAVISARRASWGATTPRRLRGLQAACCPQWPTSQSMVGVVHSRELGMLWLWSEMPAEDGNKMKPLCFRWHFSLWSIGGFHDVPQLYQGWWCGVWPYGLLQPHWPLGSYSDESHGICIPKCKWRKLAQA